MKSTGKFQQRSRPIWLKYGIGGVVLFIYSILIIGLVSASVIYSTNYENTQILENETRSFNISFDSPYIYSTLWYNNTEYTTTRSLVGGNTTFTKQLTTAKTTKDVNVTFLWEYLSNLDYDFYQGFNDLRSYWRMDSNTTAVNESSTYDYNHNIQIYCYQEFANQTSACGGVATGYYVTNIGTNPDNCFDGDYGTLCESNSGSQFLYINYTKPDGTTGAIWQKENAALANLTVPNKCLTLHDSILELRMESVDATRTDFDCYNGTAWQQLSTSAGDGFFEEGVYWNFSSGNDGTLNGYTFNHGVINNDVTINSTNGKYGNGMGFDGDGDYVESIIYNINNESNAISWWFKTEDNNQDMWHYRNDSLGYDNYLSCIIRNTGFMRCYADEGTTELNIDSNSALNDGTWYHAVFQYNGTHNELYIDGTKQTDTEEGFSFRLNVNDKLKIGKSRNTASDFNGSIDSFIIYNRSLSSQEIQAIYNNQTKYTPIGDGLIFQMASENFNSTHNYDENNLVAGKWGEAMRFDGVDDYVDLDSVTYNLSTGTTFSFWAKSGGDTDRTVFSSGTTNNFKRITLLANEKIYLETNTNADDCSSSSQSITQDNLWHHYIVMVNNSRCSFFIDTIDYTSDSTITDASIDIGRIGLEQTIRPFNGSIDDVLIFNRSLSAQEIGYLYNHTYRTNTTSYEQEVFHFEIDNCTTLLNESVVFEVKDEDNNSYINTADLSGTITYYTSLTDGYTKTYTLTSDNNANTSLCIYPDWATIYMNYDLDYEADSYPQRSKTVSQYILSTVLSEIELLLLPTSEGIYARFKTVDSYDNAISGATGTMSYGGSTIESQTSDGSGLMTFWVNPDLTYDFVFSKSGYTSYSVSLRPTTTDIYTVTLSQPTTTVNDTSSGISYEFNPDLIQLVNQTDYDFQFNLTSSYWTITDCDMELRNGSTVLSSTAGTFSGTTCDAEITYNTQNYTEIYAYGIYKLNGTEITVSRGYSIQKYAYGNEGSIRWLLEDIKNFSGSGFDDKTRMLIAFIIIIGLTGYITWKFGGLVNPEVSIITIWILVLIFSYIGWLTLNVPNLPVGISGLTNQYLIFVFVTLLSGSYIAWRHSQ